MAEWTDLSAGERQQAWAIFNGLRLHGRRNLFEICSTWAIPQKQAIRELSALEANGMMTHTRAPDGGVARRYYEANTDIRRQRYEEVLGETGRYHDPDAVPLPDETDWDENRFVLVESSTYDGGNWVTVWATPKDAFDYRDGQEYPGDWDIDYLLDLDTGEQYDTQTEYVTNLNVSPGEEPAGVPRADLAHEIAEALEAANPTRAALGEDERLVIREVLERRGVA